MSLKEHIYSVLTVSEIGSFSQNIAKFLPEYVYSPVEFARSINEARRRTAERSYDIVIINSPLQDDFGTEFAIDTSNNRTSVVLMLVRNEIYADIYAKVRDFGVFAMKKPAPSSSVMQALDWIKATRERLRNMENKAISLEEKMQEIKIINRAKWLLISELKMTESEAHRYIEKQAMDRCVSRREIAENIIKTYS